YLSILDIEINVFCRNREHITHLPNPVRENVRKFVTDCAVRRAEIAAISGCGSRCAIASTTTQLCESAGSTQAALNSSAVQKKWPSETSRQAIGSVRFSSPWRATPPPRNSSLSSASPARPPESKLLVPI